MKKFLISLCVALSVFMSNSYASYVSDSENRNIVQRFGDGVAKSIFKTAWPSATYENVELLTSDRVSDGYNLLIQFNGKSNLCFAGDCPLWFKLRVKTDSNYNVQNMLVESHNAKLRKPFETSGSIAKAILESNSR